MITTFKAPTFSPFPKLWEFRKSLPFTLLPEQEEATLEHFRTHSVLYQWEVKQDFLEETIQAFDGKELVLYADKPEPSQCDNAIRLASRFYGYYFHRSKKEVPFGSRAAILESFKHTDAFMVRDDTLFFHYGEETVHVILKETPSCWLVRAEETNDGQEGFVDSEWVKRLRESLERALSK